MKVLTAVRVDGRESGRWRGGAAERTVALGAVQNLMYGCGGDRPTRLVRTDIVLGMFIVHTMAHCW